MSREVLVERSFRACCFLVPMHGLDRMDFYNAPDKLFEKLIKYFGSQLKHLVANQVLGTEVFYIIKSFLTASL